MRLQLLGFASLRLRVRLSGELVLGVLQCFIGLGSVLLSFLLAGLARGLHLLLLDLLLSFDLLLLGSGESNLLVRGGRLRLLHNFLGDLLLLVSFIVFLCLIALADDLGQGLRVVLAELVAH